MQIASRRIDEQGRRRRRHAAAERPARAVARQDPAVEYYGLVGQTVAGIASAGAVVLVVTGLSLALRCAAGWRARRVAPAREAARSEAA